MKHALTSLVLLFLVLVPLLPAQEATTLGNDKEVQALIREQVTALRRLKALEGRVERLIKRLEGEGRTRSADLLREALQRVQARNLEAKLALRPRGGAVFRDTGRLQRHQASVLGRYRP